MRVLSWNVRGLENVARRGQVRNYILKERIDIVGLQETVKQDFSDHELNELAGGLNFIWFWLAARGRSGGILLGVKSMSWKWRIMRSKSFVFVYYQRQGV